MNTLPESQKTAQENYLTTRLRTLGITEVPFFTGSHPEDESNSITKPLFSENKTGDIEIVYAGFNGFKTYLKDGKKEVIYARTRTHPDRCVADRPKYLTPRGAGTQVYLPPQIIEAYKNESKVSTLVVTEGEFKSFKAAMHGLFCVGLQGIHNAAEKDENQNNILNTDIEAFIKRCDVKNVILLFDNDCLAVEYDLEKDLFKRPNLFFTAVKNFREMTKHLGCDVYFAHLKTDKEHKGIDDLLVALTGNENEVLIDLLSLKSNSEHFVNQNISDKSLAKLKAYFHINSVDSFYAEYQELLEGKPFRYCRYLYEGDGDKPKQIVSDAVKKFVRVGDDYYEHILKPDKTKRLLPYLDKRKKTTITDDFGSEAIKHIGKYKAFCNVPSNINFERVIGECYNAYHPLPHQAEAGDVECSLAMIRHIFGDKSDFGFDYVQLLYTKPERLLPILLLQSQERGTGKSTFGQWLIDIFHYNAVKLGNNDMESDFNSTYAEKLLIVVDETSLAKKITSEAIKRMSTEQGKIWVNAKGRQQYEIDWIGKFIFITNNEDTSLYVGKGETRYFVRTIPRFEKENNNFAARLRSEIPAFLHYLQNRKLHHSDEGRMWFDFDVYNTDELKETIEANISTTEREIKNLIEESFELFSDELELFMSAKDIADELKEVCKWKIDNSAIIRCLKKDLKMDSLPVMRYRHLSLRHGQNTSDPNVYTQNRNGRAYRFVKQNFL